MIIINIKLYLKLLNDIFRGIDNSFSTIIYLLFPKDDFLCKFKYLGNIVLNKNDRKTGVIGFLIDICQRDINLNQKKELNNKYDIILKSDLSMFKYIYFEYHENLKNLKHEILIEKLEKQGFELFFKEELFNVGIVKMIKK